MTTVLVLARSPRRLRVEGILRWAVLAFWASGLTATAQDRPVHWLNAGALPPGAIGSQRLHRGGPLSGYFQPVRIRAPQGARIALAMEGGFSNADSNDVLVGLQVGLVYRLQVSDVPNANGLDLFPTVELIGRTYPPPCLALKFPLPIELTQEELELASRGAFITRIIYIEDPNQALPVSRTVCEQPWFEALAGEDPVVTADRQGRPVAILRIGGRVPSAIITVNGGCPAQFVTFPPAQPCPENGNDVTARPAQPGRIHLSPDATANEPMQMCEAPCECRPPCMEGACGDEACIATDPYGAVVGPGDEYLCDGGDYVTPAGVHEDWTITGLEQEDAISHYDTVDGRILVVPSNRVCIYAPRFAAVRRVVQPLVDEQPLFINQTLEALSPAKASEKQLVVSQFERRRVAIDMAKQPASLFRQRQQVGGLENLQATMDAFQSVAVQANLEIIRTGEVSQAEKAHVERLSQAAIAWTGVQAPQVVFGVQQAHAEVGVQTPGVIYHTTGPDNPQLRLLKLASCGNAQVGEEVEFTLRFDNIGDQVIGNVTIVDNLSTRLEYVSGSAKSSVDADFITRSNESGSLILRWEIRDPVKPGAGGVLRFRVKVR